MALDKLVDSTQLNSDLASIANAIRAKSGNSGQLTFPAGFVSAIAGITTKETLSWHQCPEDVRNYLANVVYDPSDYTSSQITNYAPATAVASNTKPIGKAIDGTTFYNEIPNAQTPFATAHAAGTLTPLDALRWINCSVAPNVRDLGGWACDGGTVKYGKLFRGGNPGANDRDVLVLQCGVRHELDLRGTDEAQGQSASLLGSDVEYSIFQGYVWYNLTGTALWKQLLRVVFDAVQYNQPLYFHCAVGADRTGTLACVLLGLLGVSQSDVDKDYELTCFSTGTATDNAARRRNETEWRGLIMALNAYAGASFAAKCAQFVATLGFTATEINAYRAAMIDGTPSTLTPIISSYTVTNSLTHAVTDNNEATVAQYQPYSAVLTPESGYVFESVAVSVGGADVTEGVVARTYNANGQITSIAVQIVNVTGNIVITAVASAETPAYTNLFDPSSAQLNYRFNSSNQPYANNGYVLTDAIACDQSGGYKVLRVKGASISSSAKLVAYNSSDTVAGAWMANVLNVVTDAAGVGSVKVGWYESTQSDPSTDHEATASTTIRSIRLALYVKSGAVTAEDAAGIVITLDEEIA